MSGIGNYAMQAHGLALELRESLSQEEVDELRAELKSMPLREWLWWCSENREPIARFAASSPSQRKKMYAKDRTLRLRVILGAIAFAEHAARFLDAVDSRMLVPGGSYRSMLGAAGLAWWDVFSAEQKWWPFDEKSPFAK
jgi:hypothetical protein